ncbi:MAG: hypothetical protein JXD23_08325 [Spirochaetales bacterium]|nr:hypothetical protein [Spirochaetales bacterium]
MLVFIDELDGIRANSGIAPFFKLVTERLNRESLKNIGFICPGITGAVQKLEEEHAADIAVPDGVQALYFAFVGEGNASPASFTLE